MQLVIPAKAEFIINELNSRGFQAYVVGGCVRDSLLGRVPEDWDITTSARPEEVKKIFRTTIDTGIQHGTVTVMLDREGYEVTTYRTDGAYEDARHPKKVVFISNLEEDLKRRDFTINAMAYNPVDGLVDLFGGYQDIENKIVRCVGKAEERFQEDALRILRAVRFSAQLGFEIEEETGNAIQKLTANLTKVSTERIQKELNNLLLSKEPSRLLYAYEKGVTKVILPEFDRMMEFEKENPFPSYQPGEHVIRAVKEVSACGELPEDEFRKEKQAMKWAVLLYAILKPVSGYGVATSSALLPVKAEERSQRAATILRRLRFDNDTIRRASHLVHYLDFTFGVDQAEMRRGIHIIGMEYMRMLFEVKRADIVASSPGFHINGLANLEHAMKLYAKIKETGECVSLKQMAVSGTDLIGIGVEPGRQLGEILEKLLQLVLSDPQKNEKDGLISQAKILMQG